MEQRRQMLVRDPSSKEVWTAYATGCYLAKEYESCQSSCETILRFEEEDLKAKLMSPL